MASFMVKQDLLRIRPYCTGMRLLCVFTLASALLAQTNPPQQARPVDELPSIKVNVDVVSVLASVRDKKGALIANLSKEDFTILEDGKPQPIKYFTRETDLPLTIGLLIDVSGSQRNLIQIERSAASQFFAQVLQKKDEAFLISFGEEAELLQDYTGSARLLTNAMNDLRVSSGVGGLCWAVAASRSVVWRRPSRDPIHAAAPTTSGTKSNTAPVCMFMARTFHSGGKAMLLRYVTNQNSAAATGSIQS